MTPTVFIDGEAGTTGLQIRQRLESRADLQVLSIDPERRKDSDARRELLRHLRVVMDGSKDAELRSVARTRLARVLTEQAKYDEALALLNVADAGSFAALYHELRGDAYAGKGDAASARREYDEALAAQNVDSGIDRDYVALKRNALPAPAAPGAAAVAPPAAPAIADTPSGATRK